MKKDRICIKNLEIYAYHGVYPEETRLGQHFYLDVELFTDTRKAGSTDDLSHSTNYGEVCVFLDRFLKENTYQLIETVAEKAAEAVLFQYPLVENIKITVKKPQAPVPLPFETVAVTIERGWHRVYLSFGSNKGDSVRLIDDALEKLGNDPHIRMCKISDKIISSPYGGVEQDPFVNGAFAIDTLYDPHELLEVLHQHEKEAGRVREIHWGPRTLDLDILFYDDLILWEKDLIIPHRDMCNRDFVLGPLSEIAPYHIHPVYGECVESLLKKVKEKHIL